MPVEQDHRGERASRKGRLPSSSALLERVRQLRNQATQDKYDVAAWVRAVEDLKAMPISDDVRTAYEEVLAVFPSAASVWARYTESELSSGGDTNAAKTLFGRCLLFCPSMDLHQQYLRVVKRSNEARGAGGLAEVRLAYEFSLDTIGQDIGAGSLWQDYLHFLQGPKPGSEAFAALFPNAVEGQEEAMRMGVVRRAYQRAVVIPTHHVETLWRNYESWEIKLDKTLGKKILDEWRPRYQAARSVLRNRKRKVEPLNTNALPFPPGKGGPMQAMQASLWHQYIAFEKANQQKLEPDSPLLIARVSLAYNQCLTVLWNYPEVWFDNAVWQHENGGSARSAPVLERAKAAIPSCALLRFAQADMEEGAGNVEAARQVYEAMAEQLEAEITPEDDEGEEEAGEGGAQDGKAPQVAQSERQQSQQPQEGARKEGSLEAMDVDKEGKVEGGLKAESATEGGGGGAAGGKEGGTAGEQEAGAKEGAKQGGAEGGEVAVKREETGGASIPQAGAEAGKEGDVKDGTAGAQAEAEEKPKRMDGATRRELERREIEARRELEKRMAATEAERREVDRKEEIRKKKREKERERKERRDRRKRELARKEREGQLSPYGVEQGALIWVQYMRFLRRTQTDPAASRQVFLRARRWQQQSRAVVQAAEAATAAAAAAATATVGISIKPALANGSSPSGSTKGSSTVGATGWQVYAAMARMEWASDRSNAAVACRIFEKGLEDPRLAKDPAYVLAYHRFLLDAGDVDNARALFERTLSELELVGCGELWRAYAAFEYEQGDLAAALQVESRMREAMAAATAADADREGDREGAYAVEVGISGTLLQQSLQLALLKYSFEGAAPCTAQLQRHLLGSAGVLKGPSIEEEAAIAERYLRLRPEQPEELLPVLGPTDVAGPSRADRDHRELPSGRGPPSKWEEGPPRDREGSRGARRVAPPERADRGDRDRDMGREDLGPPDMLELLARDLPPPLAVEGPLVPVEAVWNVLRFYRNTPEAVQYVCTELDAGRVPDGITGPSEGVPVPQVLAMTPEGRQLLSQMGALPPSPSGPGNYPPHARYPPHPGMIHEPPPFVGEFEYGDMGGAVPFEEMPPHPAYHGGPPRKRGRWEEDVYAGYEAEAIPHPKQGYQYHTPHPSQWHTEDRPRKSHPAVRGGGRGRGRPARDEL